MANENKDYLKDIELLSNFEKMINELNATKGTNAKKEVLLKYELLKPLIGRIWDSQIKTFITSTGLEKYKKEKLGLIIDSGEYGKLSIEKLFDKLAQREITGDKAKLAIFAYIKARPGKYKDLIIGILTKEIKKIKIGAKMILSVFPDLFEKQSIALAANWDEDKFNELMKEFAEEKPPAFLSRKYDGVRLITTINYHGKNPKIEFLARSGKNFVADMSLLEAEILEILESKECIELKKKFTKGFVFDGELVITEGDNKDNKDNFAKTVSTVRQIGKKLENCNYQIFDLLSLELYRSDEKAVDIKDIYSIRYKRLQELMTTHIQKIQKGNKILKVMEQIPFDEKTFEQLKKVAAENKWEGLMVRFNYKYEAKRSHKLMKYKFFHTEEFKVKDVVLVDDYPFDDGKGGRIKKPALKSVIIEYKGNDVSVGSGFTEEQRLRYYKHPEEIKDKTISVQYADESYDTKNKTYSLRFPTFQYLWGEKRDV